jgi:hypothetical protein
MAPLGLQITTVGALGGPGMMGDPGGAAAKPDPLWECGDWSGSGATLRPLSLSASHIDNNDMWNFSGVGTSNYAFEPEDDSIHVVSDETTSLLTGDDKVKFLMPYAFTLTEVKAFVSTAPTGAALTLQVTEGGADNNINSSAISISASANTANTTSFGSGGGSNPDANIAEDAVIGINIDQVGSTEAGKGLKVTLIGYQS